MPTERPLAYILYVLSDWLSGRCLTKFRVAPAQIAIENEVKSFTAGRENKTIYQGLSHDVDRAWGELYNR